MKILDENLGETQNPNRLPTPQISPGPEIWIHETGRPGTIEFLCCASVKWKNSSMPSESKWFRK